MAAAASSASVSVPSASASAPAPASTPILPVTSAFQDRLFNTFWALKDPELTLFDVWPTYTLKSVEERRATDPSAPKVELSITPLERLEDIATKKQYTSFEAWYEARGPTLLGLAPGATLPPLSTELLFGRGKEWMSFEEILHVATVSNFMATLSC